MKQRILFVVAFLFIIGCGVVPSVGTVASTLDITTEVVTETPASPSADYKAYLPNPDITPGDTLDVTSADVCVSGYSSKVRNVPDSVKTQAYNEYGIYSHTTGQYEVDHLISLELGGSNSLKNLWPESYTGPWNAHIKDKLENHLHSLVCNNSIDLKTAQQEIATDWIAAYIKYYGQP